MTPTKFKFRAYDSQTQKFYYSDKMYTNHYFMFHDDTLNCFGEDYKCSPVEMFTGFLDEDETEIYAGDIISFRVDCFVVDWQYRGCVVFTGQRFQLWNKPDNEYYGSDGGFDLDWICYQDDTLKIVGNIHQNPELIEEGK